jgi:endonuclease/exonuclease/phosphatase family metal-dependent hydrolase
MFDPKKEFENDRKKFSSTLPFTYIWKSRSDNREHATKVYNEYKDRLGWYTSLYNMNVEGSNSESIRQIDIYSELYDPYKKLALAFTKLKNIKEKIETSFENKFTKDGSNYIFKKGNYIYKGTKYFYKPEDEKQFFDTLPFGYYGDKYVAYYYSKRYSGGLQVYKLRKDLKLFNVTNDKNILMILNMIKDLFKQGKADEIIFDNVSYKELYKAIKVKYGVGINKYFHAYNISKYTRFKDIWLYEPEEDLSSYANHSDKSYTGWYYGAGRIDRVCARGIMLLMQDKFDGITSQTGFYSPFNSLTGVEVIIWNQNDALERKPNNKYDSMQFIKKLHFNPFDINFDINLSAKNEKFRMINYYLNHKLDLSSINIQSQSSNIIIMSLNVHNFKSINLNDKPEMILKTILDICEHLNVDMCCLQEYYNTNLEIQSLNYAYIKDEKHIGLVVIYKKTLKITDISSFVLPNDKYLDQRRFGLMFNLNNKKFIITHLEIGKRYFDRTGSLLLADDLYKVIQFNHKIRINQLNRILQENPDYIIGDFNFNSLDKEYEYLTKKCNYYTGLVDYTTPFGKQVDFIFSKNPYKLFTKINFQYSDHLPIIAVL